ncbi:MAG: GWxTD domain-containing protein, partial [Candidatus Aminicenantes bacterium]
TKSERKIFSHLTTDEARERFVRNFWEIRDPNPFTDENEFKMEMERRYEYVSKYLKEGPIPGWKTDRGRIYILLGPPSYWQEDTIYPGRIIQWYFDEYNIYVRFIDSTGEGIYHMDLTSVSLGLLDVLDNKKYFIVNKEGKISWKPLDFDLSYDSETREILFEVSGKNLNYEKAPGDSDHMTAQIKVDLVVYPADKADDFFKHSQVKTVKVQEEKLLEKDAAISFRIPLELPGGQVKIDAIVADFLGEVVHRRLIKLNVKK